MPSPFRELELLDAAWRAKLVRMNTAARQELFDLVSGLSDDERARLHAALE